MKKFIITSLLVLSSSLFTLSLAQTGIINTIAGGGTGGLGDGGQATAAQLNFPFCVAIDKVGNLYITDNGSNEIRKIDVSSGIITTIAGNGYGAYSGDGGQATDAELEQPCGIALDSADNLYIADEWHNIIRKVDNSTGIISTCVGNGYQVGGGSGGGFSGDGGSATAAELSRPNAVYLDKSGNIYIADYYNNRIRKITDSTEIITTVAGNGYGAWHGVGTWTGQYVGDGGMATDAELYGPSAIAVDDSNNIIISDGANDVIRKVGITGIITTIAGNGVAGYMGNGGPATAARLYYPEASLDASGNMYIADDGNNVIRFVDKSTGIITTIAGMRTGGFSGDGGPATDAELVPQFVLPTDSGNFYIADAGNNRIRKVSHDTNTITGIKKSIVENQISVYPNPATDKITFDFNKVVSGNIEIYDMMGQEMFQSNINSGKIEINIKNNPTGVYFYRVISKDNKIFGEGKLIIER